MLCVMQEWTLKLSLMQQTVLIEMTRGPDGLAKYHKSKFLLRWYRRCILWSAFEREVKTTPWEPGGGSFTGPSYDALGTECYDAAEGEPYISFGAMRLRPTAPWEVPMGDLLNEVIRSADELPHHFYRHMMHAFEIVGYKHPDERIRTWWNMAYNRLAKDMHLTPETEEQLDHRLGDNREQWLSHADEATLA